MVQTSGIKAFHKRSHLHIERKIWHASTVTVMALCYLFAPTWVSMTLLSTGLVISVVFDVLRKRNPSINEVLIRIFGPLMRSNEVEGWAGTTFLLIGVSISVLLFHEKITLVSLFFLAFADPLASYFGIRFGKIKIFGHKSLEGALAAFVTCSFIMILFCLGWGVYLDQLLTVALLAGLAGALSEAVPIFDLDDNLTFPVMSSLFLMGIFSILNRVSEFPLNL